MVVLVEGIPEKVPKAIALDPTYSSTQGPLRYGAGDTGHCVTVLCETNLCPSVRWKLLLSHLSDEETDSQETKNLKANWF